MPYEIALLELVEDFAKRVSSLRPTTRFRKPARELFEDRNWDLTWSDHHGVYYCVRGPEKEVVWVGVAEPGFLGSRVWNLIMPNHGNVPGLILNDPETEVGIILFDDDDSYWALALEMLLIKRLHPEFNVRGRVWFDSDPPREAT